MCQSVPKHLYTGYGPLGSPRAEQAQDYSWPPCPMQGPSDPSCPPAAPKAITLPAPHRISRAAQTQEAETRAVSSASRSREWRSYLLLPHDHSDSSCEPPRHLTCLCYFAAPPNTGPTLQGTSLFPSCALTSLWLVSHPSFPRYLPKHSPTTEQPWGLPQNCGSHPRGMRRVLANSCLQS